MFCQYSSPFFSVLTRVSVSSDITWLAFIINREYGTGALGSVLTHPSYAPRSQIHDIWGVQSITFLVCTEIYHLDIQEAVSARRTKPL